MTMFQRLFPSAAKVEKAEKRAESAEAAAFEVKERHETLWKSYHALEAISKKQSEEIDALKTKLREQNDADLMLVSGKIICAVLRGEKPKDEDVFRHSALMKQRASMGLGSPYGYQTNSGIGQALFGLAALGGAWHQ